MNTPRKSLSDILPGRGSGGGDIFDRFDAAEAADDFGPLPKGVYVAVAIGGELTQAKTGTRGYRVTFRVTEGEHANRRLFMEKYFTEAALPYTKRDLAKLGIDSKAKLHGPFPADRFVCKLTVALRKDDDGTERNEVKNLDVLRVQDPPADPFAPAGDGDPPPAGGTDFAFGANGGPQS